MNHRILTVAALAVFSGYLPWYAFSAVIGPAATDLGLSTHHTGIILAAFQAGYVVAVIPLGYLADRFGPGRIMAISLLTCSLSCLATGLVPPGLWPAMTLRTITGCASAGLYAPALALLRAQYAPHKLSYPFGVLTAALTGSYALTFALAGPLTALLGWRWALILTGVPALPVWLALRSQLGTIDGAAADVGLKALVAGFGRVAGSRPALAITVAYVGHMWEQYGFWAWIGPFLVSRALAGGLMADEAQIAGSIVAFAVIGAGVAGAWGWSFMATRMTAWSAVAIAGAASCIGIAALPLATGNWLYVIAVWCGTWVIADSALFKVLLANLDQPGAGLSSSLAVQSAVGYGAAAVAPWAAAVVLSAFNGPVNPVHAEVWAPAFFLLAAGGMVVPVTATAMLIRGRR